MTTLIPTLAAMLDLLRSYPDATFDSSNSAIDDTRVMASEGRDYSVILDAGPTAEDDVSEGKYQEQHLINTWFCWKRGTGEGGDAAQKQALRNLTEGVKDYMRPYETLNDAPNVFEARIIETSAADYIVLTVRLEMSSHIVQRVTWRVTCESELGA